MIEHSISTKTATMEADAEAEAKLAQAISTENIGSLWALASSAPNPDIRASAVSAINALLKIDADQQAEIDELVVTQLLNFLIDKAISQKARGKLARLAKMAAAAAKKAEKPKPTSPGM